MESSIWIMQSIALQIQISIFLFQKRSHYLALAKLQWLYNSLKDWVFSYSKTHQLIPEELGVKSTITTDYKEVKTCWKRTFFVYFWKRNILAYFTFHLGTSVPNTNVILDTLDSIVTNTVVQVGVYLLWKLWMYQD